MLPAVLHVAHILSLNIISPFYILIFIKTSYRYRIVGVPAVARIPQFDKPLPILNSSLKQGLFWETKSIP